MKQSTYDKIELVMKHAGKSLAEHEFRSIVYEGHHDCGDKWGMKYNPSGLTFVGCSESTLGRRLRELREKGRVTSQRREGKAFVEYALAVTIKHEEPVCPV